MTIAELFSIVCEIISAISILAPGCVFFFKLYGRIKAFLSSQKRLQLKVQECSRQISEDLNEIRQQIGLLSQTDKDQSEGLLCVLRERLLKEMDICIQAGTADEFVRDRVEHMYHAYKQLGGNGMLESVYQQFRQLKFSHNAKRINISKNKKGNQ